MKRQLIAIVLVLGATVASARAQGSFEDTLLSAGKSAPGALVSVSVAAPIFVRPDASRAPLRVAREGSILRLIEQDGEWVYVEFADPQYSRRFGYIQSRFVRVIPSEIAQQPLDLSVPEARSLQPAPQFAPQPAPQERLPIPDRNADGAPARELQVFKNYGSVQMGTFIIDHSLFGREVVIDAGHNMGHNVEIYSTAGWLLEYVDAWHVTGGVKLMIPTASHVRPYVRAGLGVIASRLGDFAANTGFVGEGGAGVAFEVGSRGYLDLGYRGMFSPSDIATVGLWSALSNGLGGVYVGFGFRY